MPEALDQSEVDALLAALDSGEVGEGELDLAADKARQVEIHEYDFKRPERVSKDQMRALESLHENFARNFGASLSGFLRTIVEVKVANIEQLTYAEFIHSLPNPTCFNLLSCDKFNGQMCLEISPLIVYPIIDRLLGGSNAELFIPQRALTQIELRLVRRITDRVLENMTDAWSNLIDAKFELTQTESNPQLVQIVPPNEVVVVIGFEIKMGNRAGTMSLCIPFNAIEPVMSALLSQNWFALQRRAPEGHYRHRVVKTLNRAPVEIIAELARTKITLAELRHLQVGDIIRTEKPVSSPIPLYVGGKIKLAGRIGRFKGQRAIRILRHTRPDERF